MRKGRHEKGAQSYVLNLKVFGSKNVLYVRRTRKKYSGYKKLQGQRQRANPEGATAASAPLGVI